MNSLLLTSLAAFAASLLLTAVVRAIAPRCSVLDRPDGKRKLHGRPVPLLGGAAVYGAAVLGLLAIRVAGGATVQFTELSTAWMIAAGFVCFVGGIDDCFNLPSRVKLALQICSVLPIVLLGYYVDRIVAFGYPIYLGWFGVPLTVLWLVGCINALNLIDGMDGLASIVGLSTAAMLGVIAASEGHDHVAAMAIVLTASLAGFLIYNLPPASIFLGDSGSMVIGLSLGLLGMQGALKTSATLAITAPAVVMTLPIFDIVAAVVRRRLPGRRIDAPDRLHIHHRLLARGWTPWQVLCLIGALCLTMGGAATAATIFRRDALAWIAAMILVVLMIRLRLFGYEEFALAKEAVRKTLASYGERFSRLARWIAKQAASVRADVRRTEGQPRKSEAEIQGSPFTVRWSEAGGQDTNDWADETRLSNLRLLPADASPVVSEASEAWDRLLHDLRAQKSPASGVPLVARRCAAPDLLDRPGIARRRALPLVGLGVAAGRRRRAVRTSRRRRRAPLGENRCQRSNLVAENIWNAVRRRSRTLLRTAAPSQGVRHNRPATRPPAQGGIACHSTILTSASSIPASAS